MCSLFTIISSTYIFFTFLLMENARCIWVLFFFCFFFFSLFKVFPLTGRIKMKSVMIFFIYIFVTVNDRKYSDRFSYCFFFVCLFPLRGKKCWKRRNYFGGEYFDILFLFWFFPVVAYYFCASFFLHFPLKSWSLLMTPKATLTYIKASSLPSFAFHPSFLPCLPFERLPSLSPSLP